MHVAFVGGAAISAAWSVGGRSGAWSVEGRSVSVSATPNRCRRDLPNERRSTAKPVKMVVSNPATTSTNTSSKPNKPSSKPASPCFSSGPCKKRPGYSLDALSDAALGRSHRSKLGLQKIREATELTKQILELPEGYRVAIMPASDTGAVEAAMWSLLGPRPVDICYWDAFGKGWLTDATRELKLENVRDFSAAYGELPDLASTDASHDVVFTWNGTTSGARVPDGEWIAADRAGLTICDATSAVFAMRLPWDKLDVTTFSWQKVLGGEAAHGVIILSPRAVERLETYTPPWPVPKIFRMASKGKLDEKLFDGSVINTVSLLCVEDYLDALRWTQRVGGVDGLVQRSERNLKVLQEFVDERPWIDFLAADASVRSPTSVCLTLKLEKPQVKEIEKLLENEGVAFDINSYRDAPSGLRVWCGATVEEADLRSLCEWLEYAYQAVTQSGAM